MRRLKSGYERGAHVVTLEIETLLFERCERTVLDTLCGPGMHFGNAALNSAIWFVPGDGNSVRTVFNRSWLARKTRKLEHNLNCPFSKSLPDSLSHSG